MNISLVYVTNTNSLAKGVTKHHLSVCCNSAFPLTIITPSDTLTNILFGMCHKHSPYLPNPPFFVATKVSLNTIYGDWHCDWPRKHSLWKPHIYAVCSAGCFLTYHLAMTRRYWTGRPDANPTLSISTVGSSTHDGIMWMTVHCIFDVWGGWRVWLIWITCPAARKRFVHKSTARSLRIMSMPTRFFFYFKPKFVRA